MRRRFSVVLLGSLLCFSGCGGKPELEKAEVSGTVTYNGDPIETGLIQFVPKEGTKGPMAAGSIVNGKYTVTATGGVPLGTHQVEITGWFERPDLRAADVPFAPTPRSYYIPEQYNKRTTLEATIEAEKDDPVDFKLEGPPRELPPGGVAKKE